jgi:hypothetical protein
MSPILRSLAYFWLVLPLWAQTPAAPRVFKATGQLGVPALIGWDYVVLGTHEKIETGSVREATLASAELATVFPNREENVIATAGEKLLILRSSLRNPEKTSVEDVYSDKAFSLRLWQGYKGPGKFKFVAHFDPDTLHFAKKELKSGESVKIVSVWRVPNDFVDFRIGLTFERPEKVPWFDLSSSIGHIQSAFASADGLSTNDSAKIASGEAFDFAGFEMRVGAATEPELLAGSRRPNPGHRYVVNVTATNKLLLPTRWGWQYFTVELVGVDGSVTKAFPDIIDAATDRSWFGDLNAGATTTGRFQFASDTAKVPQAFRMTNLATGRSVEVALGR